MNHTLTRCFIFLLSTFDLQSYEMTVITDRGQVTMESCCYERFYRRVRLIERCPNQELNFFWVFKTFSSDHFHTKFKASFIPSPLHTIKLKEKKK